MALIWIYQTSTREDLARTLKAIHAAQVPPELRRLIPREEIILTPMAGRDKIISKCKWKKHPFTTQLQQTWPRL